MLLPQGTHTSIYTHARYMFCVRVGSLLPAETPIEEFTPTPAFPALQYLESVDLDGVAWRAGLRTGDFLIEVRRCLLNPENTFVKCVNKLTPFCKSGEWG